MMESRSLGSNEIFVRIRKYGAIARGGLYDGVEVDFLGMG